MMAAILIRDLSLQATIVLQQSEIYPPISPLLENGEFFHRADV